MNIALEHYKVFYYVAKNASFTKAAQELNVSQSAVSQTVKTLEQRLNTTLLIRTTKKVSPTIDGQILYEHIKRAFEIIHIAQTKLANRQDVVSGEVTIASTDTLCKYYLLDEIKKLQSKYPKIRIKIINKTSFECLNLLETGRVDLAVINIPHTLDGDKFEIHMKHGFNDAFVCSEHFNNASGLSLKEISVLPLLLLGKSSVTRQFMDNLFAGEGIEVEPEIEALNIDLLLEMAKIGFGITFVPDICLKNSGLRRISVAHEIPERYYGLLSLKYSSLTPVSRAFIKMLKKTD